MTAALILVDIQNDYFPKGLWPVPKMESVSKNAQKLLKHARDNNIFVVHIQHISSSSDAAFFKPGDEGSNIHDSVAPLEHEVIIVKSKPSSFANTELNNILVQNGVKDVMICGAMSQVCIDSIARSSIDLGYNTTIVHDACGAKEVSFGGVSVAAELVHATIMAAFAGFFGSVVSTQEILTKAT